MLLTVETTFHGNWIGLDPASLPHFLVLLTMAIHCQE